VITKNDLKQLLSKKILRVKFKKKDQTEREMKCTLRADIIPVYEKKTDKVKKTNENVLAVWDLDKDGFRSFKLDSLIDYQVMMEGYEL